MIHLTLGSLIFFIGPTIYSTFNVSWFFFFKKKKKLTHLNFPIHAHFPLSLTYLSSSQIPWFFLLMILSSTLFHNLSLSFPPSQWPSLYDSLPFISTPLSSSLSHPHLASIMIWPPSTRILQISKKKHTILPPW